MTRSLHVPTPVKLIALGHLGFGALWSLCGLVLLGAVLFGDARGGGFLFSTWDVVWLAAYAGGLGVGLLATGCGLWAGARPARWAAVALAVVAGVLAVSAGAWWWALIHGAVAVYMGTSAEVARAFR